MLKKVTFYWKANCDTSRKAKAFLEKTGVKFTARELGKEPLSPEEMKRISSGKPITLIDRRKPSFRKLGIGDKPLTDKEAVALMMKNPSIITRPIYEIDGQIIFNNEADKLKKLLG